MQHAEDSLDLLDVVVAGAVSRLEADGTGPSSLANIRKVLDARKNAIDRIHSLAIGDANGNWLTSRGSVSTTFSNDQFFRHHQLSAEPGAFVGHPVRDLNDGEWVVTLSRRFNHPDGSFAGVVVATISSKYLAHFYEQLELTHSSSIVLAHAQGPIMARSPDNENFVGRDLSQQPLVRELQRSNDAYVSASLLGGAEQGSFLKHGKRFPLVLLVGVNESAFFPAWRTILPISGVLGLVLLIVMMGRHHVRQLAAGQRVAAALASSQVNLRLLAASSTDMVTRIGVDDLIKYASPSSAQIVGWKPNELVGRSAFAEINTADLPAVQEALERLKRGEIEEARTVHRTVHREKGEIWIESTLRVTRKGDGTVDGAVAISRDVTEQKQLETRAIEDGLTGLANRRCFDERLREEWACARRDRTSIGLLMIDVDRFKAYNDERGHPAGDSCLQRVGKILAAEVQRPADLAARYGGEEFAILLPDTDATGCARVGERIRRAIHEAAIVHASNVPSGVVTVSIGAVVRRPAVERLADSAVMVEAADRALYSAKQTGRDRLVMSDEIVTYLAAAS